MNVYRRLSRRVISRRGSEERKGYRGVKRIKEHYIYTYEEYIMKSTKH
jgi:hypothetical protein